MFFQPVHIVAEYDGKIASKSCRKKIGFLTPYLSGFGIAREIYGKFKWINSKNAKRGKLFKGNV